MTSSSHPKKAVSRFFANWAWLRRVLRGSLRHQRRAIETLSLGSRSIALGFGRRGREIVRLETAGVVLLRSSSGNPTPRRLVRIVDAPPELAAEMLARQATLVDAPVAHVAVIENAMVKSGVVSLASGAIVGESLINRTDPIPYQCDPKDRPVTVQPRIGFVRRYHSMPHVLLKQHWDANYSHWLVEGLPRIAIVEDHFNLRDLRFIVSGYHGRMQQVYRDSLALFGIRSDQIVEVAGEPIHVHTLIYPAPMTRHPWHIAPRCIDVLEQLATRVRANPYGFERLYVSRNRTSKRHLRNEAAIIAIVERHGFTVVEPETLTLYQQIGLFRQARIVVGSYGAALTNAAFATEDVTLFALTSAFMQDDFLSTLMSHKRGRYLSLHGAATDPDRGADSDFHIDVEVFGAMLRTVV